MELRRAGETLMRSHPSLLLSTLLTPPRPLHRAIFRTSPSTSSLSVNAAQSSRRTFSLSRSLCQQGAAAAAARPAPPQEDTQEQQEDLDARDTDFLNTALDSHKTTGISAKHTSRFKSNHAQATHPSSSSMQSPIPSEAPSEDSSPTSSADELREAYTKAMAQGPSAVGQLSTSLFEGPRRASRGAAQPTAPSYSSSMTAKPTYSLPKKLDLTPSTGRSIEIAKEASRVGMDLGRGIRALEILCARNKVKQDFFRQRFHERAGLKRKRLKSERWRKRFKTGFRAVLKRVDQLRKKGW